MTLRGTVALLTAAVRVVGTPPREAGRCHCGGVYGTARRVSWRQSHATCARCGVACLIFDEID